MFGEGFFRVNVPILPRTTNPSDRLRTNPISGLRKWRASTRVCRETEGRHFAGRFKAGCSPPR